MARTDPSSEGRGLLVAVAVFKLVKAALLLSVAAGVLRLLHGDAATTVRHWVLAARADPHDRWIEAIVNRLTGLSRERLEAVGLGLLLYAALFGTEGVGLLLRRRWAEWLTVVSTALLLPLEVHELARRPTALRALVLIANVLVVIYLIVRLRRRDDRPQT